MTDYDPQTGSNRQPAAPHPPEPVIYDPIVRPRQRWLSMLVWLLPILAALAGVALAAQALLQSGPTITISFNNAEGIEPQITKVKYKNVNIGVVKNVALSNDLSHVLVKVELTKTAAALAVSDTRFWVVRPRVALNGVSGLNTLLSGAYIGVDAGQSKTRRTEFEGLEVPPAVTRDQQGRQFLLHSDNLGSVDIGTPVFYRRIQVGQIVAFNLDPDGNGVSLKVFINAPYDRYVRTNTRFWHASGVNLRVDSNGIKLNTQALAAILVGGVAFETPPGQNLGEPAPPEYPFELADDRSQAMRTPDGHPITVVFNFNQSVRGLTPGAELDFRGIQIGEVQSIDMEFEPKTQSFKMPVTAVLYPDRLGASFAQHANPNSLDQTRLLVASLVKHGLRAQLRNGNLLTGQLYIALDYFPRAKPVRIDLSQPQLELPTEPNTLDELQNQLQNIARQLNKVPFDQIGNNLNSTLKQANHLFARLNTQLAPQAQQTLRAAQKAFGQAQQTLSTDAPWQNNLQQTLEQLNRTLQSVNALADYLERHPEALLRGKQEDKQ